MKFFSVAAILAAVASTVNAIQVNTPASAVECQPLQITWDPQGSAGPFFLSVVPGGSPSSPALFSWSGLTGTSYTWTVAEPAGTSLGLLLRDQTGAISQSAAFTVQAGTVATCLNSTSSVSLPLSSSLSSLSSNSSSSSSSKPSTNSTTIISTTKPLVPTPTPTPARSSSSSSSPSPSSSTSTSGKSSGNSKSGAISNAVNFGSAGPLVALIVAILA